MFSLLPCDLPKPGEAFTIHSVFITCPLDLYSTVLQQHLTIWRHQIQWQYINWQQFSVWISQNSCPELKMTWRYLRRLMAKLWPAWDFIHDWLFFLLEKMSIFKFNKETVPLHHRAPVMSSRIESNLVYAFYICPWHFRVIAKSIMRSW